jgi:D-beta-D-heptose 7-phosphate kinase/D-beta-D-heptose 1-phosphate adenosyltransferase
MKNTGSLLEVLDRFARVKVLVIGDVMLDRYWWGNASRLSPEAPVPVVALEKVTHIPGGAANVAANIAGLGAEVFLAGVIGEDDAADCLCRTLRQINVKPDFLITSGHRQTTTKTRVLVHNQQVARVDDETSVPLAAEEEEKLVSRVLNLIVEADIIVLSDYAKGCLTPTLVAKITAAARNKEKIVLADPKSRDFTKYNGVDFLTPNLSEAMVAAGIEKGDENSADVAVEKIFAETTINSLLITLSEHGMKLFRRDAAPIHFPSVARQVFDVTGAGDTVIASLAVALAAKTDIHSAIALANTAAGLAVEKVGTSIVPLQELRSVLHHGFSNLS